MMRRGRRSRVGTGDMHPRGPRDRREAEKGRRSPHACREAADTRPGRHATSIRCRRPPARRKTGFMLLCCSLVMLMTPGLAFCYGGLVGRKNVLAIMIQSFISLCWTTVVWFVCGYSLCFSGGAGGVIGNLDMAFLRGVNLMAPSPNDTIPLIVHVAYQMMFAIITPALITGAFAHRVTFKAYFIFLTLWLLLVYFPFVHMIWGNGLLAKWGVLDFAGGIVVHNTAGLAALASVIYVGRRRVKDTGPHSIPLVALGTGLLWFGWYGFNAGPEFRVGPVTATA